MILQCQAQRDPSSARLECPPIRADPWPGKEGDGRGCPDRKAEATWQAGRSGGPHHEAGVAGLDAQLRQHPDAIGQLEGLVKHVLALHVPLGDGEDVAALQPTAHGLWGSKGPQSEMGRPGAQARGSMEWGRGSGVLPAFRGQSLIWNWASFSLGMSFHVARNICRSGG